VVLAGVVDYLPSATSENERLAFRLNTSKRPLRIRPWPVGAGTASPVADVGVAPVADYVARRGGLV